MASSRPRRANAGNKMARLLNEEEEDEFYKTTYGGFEETEQDNDYKYNIPFVHFLKFFYVLSYTIKLFFQRRSRSGR